MKNKIYLSINNKGQINKILTFKKIIKILIIIHRKALLKILKNILIIILIIIQTYLLLNKIII